MKEKYNYENIFHSYTKYRPITFNKVMVYDNSIFKFKERVRVYNKIQKEMEINLTKRKLEPVEIFIKEDNKKKIYIDKSQSDHEQIGSNGDQNSTKQLEQTNFEPHLEINQEDKENKNVLNDDKKFVIIGPYSDISNALIKRGWSKSNDEEPKIISYSFINTIKISDIPYEDLRDDIIINHFRKILQITKKVSLLKNIRNLYFMNVCPDDFYPRAYDLEDKNDVADFIEDFKISRAIALLRKCKELNGINVNKDEIYISLNIVKKRLNLLIGKTI